MPQIAIELREDDPAVEYLALPGARRPLGREERLLLAVLEDAVGCLRRHATARGGRARRAFEEARAWLESSDRTSLFACETICDVLDIDVDCLRRGLRAWTAAVSGPCGRTPGPRARPRA